MDKLGTDRPAGRRSESAWEDLRDVAKVGLDDPALLRNCEHLLSLPSVRDAAAAGDALSVTRALARLLRELLDDLRREASPERAERIGCLFMLDPEWKGLQITRRREHLAGVGYEGDTSSFRRNKERPLYEEIVALLREGARAETERPSVQKTREPFPSKWWVPPAKEPEAAIVRLLTSIEQAQESVVGYLNDSADHSRLEALRRYSLLLVRFEELFSQQIAGYITILIYPVPGFYNALVGSDELQLDLDSYDLSLLRHVCKAAHPEIAAFPDLLEATKRGQAILEKWKERLDECGCPETTIDPECKVHTLLREWNSYGTTLSKKYGLDFEPLDLEATLGR